MLLFTDHWLLRAVLLIGPLALLTACGGGGGGETPTSTTSSSPDFVVFSGNANGTVILDGANNKFALTKKDDKLFSITNNIYLSGLTIDGGSNVLSDGVIVGAIAQGPSSDGQSIAFLICSGPAPNLGKMTVIVTGSSYSYKCASNTGIVSPSGGGASPSSPVSKVDNSLIATDCLKTTKSSGSDINITNNCSFTVAYSFCNSLPDQYGRLFQCKAISRDFSPTGFTYGQGADDLPAGRTTSLQGSSASGNLAYVAACKGKIIAEVSPFIIDFSGPIGDPKTTFSIICNKI